MVYNGYTMNAAASPADNMIELVEAAVTPITDQVIENKQGRDGMEVYQAYKSGLMIRLRGYIKKPTLAELMDEAGLMAEKFDAALLSRRTQFTTIGFVPLAFNVPTADGANYSGGLVPSFYLARTMEPVTFGRTKYDGYAVPFKIEMLARDPSRFYSVQQAVAVNGTALNTLGRYPSWPTFTMTMTGAGNAAFTLTNAQAFGGSKSLVLNLSTLVNGDIVRVDFEQKRIYVNNILRMGLYVSGYYWQIEPRVNSTLTATNTTNTSIRNLTWYRAFPI